MRNLRAVAEHSALIGVSVVFLTPLLWMLSTSLKPDGAEFEYPPRLIPSTLALENYVRGLTIRPLLAIS